MKLYLAAYAPNPRRVSMFLAEKGVTDIAIEVIDLQKGDQRTPAYRVLSPHGQTPALVLDDGRVLTESRAICTYLESLYPEPNLMGRDGFERAHIEMWDRRAEQLMAYPLMLWVRHASPILARVELGQNPAIAEANRETAMAMAAWFDRELAQRAFVAGDRVTTADLTLLAGMDFAKMMRWRPGEEFPNLARWRAMMGERPSGQTPP